MSETSPEDLPREVATETPDIPEGAELREDGSYVLPDETVHADARENPDGSDGSLLEDGIHDEAGNNLAAEQAAVAAEDMPREQGTF